MLEKQKHRAHVLRSLANFDAIRTLSHFTVVKLRGSLKKYIFTYAVNIIITSNKLSRSPSACALPQNLRKMSIDAEHDGALALCWRLIDVFSRVGSERNGVP